MFIDLSKAFDCVDHQIFISILNNQGIRGIPLSWIESYLSNRFQQVEISGKLSEKISLQYGVTQRSNLGPILFLLYVNSCASAIIINGTTIQYADDTSLCFRNKSENQAFIGLNNCFQYFAEKIFKQLYFFESNSKVNNNNTNINIMLNGVLLEEQDLGICVEKHLFGTGT